MPAYSVCSFVYCTSRSKIMFSLSLLYILSYWVYFNLKNGVGGDFGLLNYSLPSFLPFLPCLTSTFHIASKSSTLTFNVFISPISVIPYASFATNMLLNFNSPSRLLNETVLNAKLRLNTRTCSLLIFLNLRKEVVWHFNKYTFVVLITIIRVMETF